MTYDHLRLVCRNMASDTCNTFYNLHGLDAEKADTSEPMNAAQKVRHLLWLCQEMPLMFSNDVEKTMRFLGFAQGMCLDLGVYMTIDEMRVMNRP